MRLRFVVAGCAALLATAIAAQPVAAQPGQAFTELVVHAGRPLRVALDERIRLTQVGQAVTGTVIEGTLCGGAFVSSSDLEEWVPCQACGATGVIRNDRCDAS